MKLKSRLALAVAVAIAASLGLWLPGVLSGGGGAKPSEYLDLLQPRPDLPLATGETDVLVAILCTLRADRLQPYGQGRPTSPFLQALAAHGVTFERTVLQAPWTRPSVGALLTGRWPRVLHLDHPQKTKLQNRALPEGHTTIAELMASEGYSTVGASGNPNISSTFNFDRGFHRYREPDALWRDGGTRPPSGDTVVEQIAEELAEIAPTGPLYVQAMFVDTHAPRTPPMWAREALRGTSDPGDPTPLPREVRIYDASVLSLDTHLARLVALLHARNPNLLVVMIGDHGEGLLFPESHGPGHGNHLFRSTTDAPFIIFHPALPAPGRRVGGMAAGIDLLPTVGDLLGMEISGPTDGVSQAEAVLGERDRASHEVMFAETFFRHSTKSAVYTEEMHLVRNRQARPGRGDSLYLAGATPEEEDVIAQRQEEAATLSARLDEWEEEMSRQAAAAPPPLEADVPDSTENMLRTLGYVD